MDKQFSQSVLRDAVNRLLDRPSDYRYFRQYWKTGKIYTGYVVIAKNNQWGFPHKQFKQTQDDKEFDYVVLRFDCLAPDDHLSERRAFKTFDEAFDCFIEVLEKHSSQ